MRLHTTATETDVHNAARKAGVTIEHVSTHGSRKAERGIEVRLSGSGTRANGGMYGAADYSAATWDEWGMFLAELYLVDPAMIAGEAYRSVGHFAWSTGNRYDTLRPTDQHKRHRWNYSGEAVTGRYRVSECKCGAVRRWLVNGADWELVSC